MTDILNPADTSPPTPEPRVRFERARANDRDPYGENSRYSYFRDLRTIAASVHRADKSFTRALKDGGLPRDGGGPLPSSLAGGEAEARRRLYTSAEQRDLSSTAGAGGEFLVAAGPPMFIADAFATAARARSVLASVLPTRPLPASGLKVMTPRYTTGAAVAIHVENNPVQETDPTSSLASAPVGTIAGHVDVSQQLLDRAPVGLDVGLGGELGNAYGEKLDQQVISGTGTSGQILGLLTVSGITAVTYTSASPTAAENLANVGKLVATTATAFGGPIDTLLVHPRRAAFIRSKIGGAIEWPANVVEVGGLPTNLGAGTNEDVVIALQRGESPLFLEPMNFRVFEDVLSANLTARVQVYGYAALLANRQPASIGKLSGTGLTPPTW